MLDPQILYEDNFLLIINKPAGIVVNNSESVKDEETIADWAENKILLNTNKNKEASEFMKRSGLVHRLDRETSGVLMIAKNEAIFDEMLSKFKNREIKKTYFALVHGTAEKDGLLNNGIIKHHQKGKMIVDEVKGKDAITEYKTSGYLNFYPVQLSDFLKKNFDRLKNKYNLINYSFVKIKLHTGRTHQIRVHFSHINHPVAGDNLYGWRKVVKFERAWCPRLFLHARSLEFTHPISGRLQKIDAPVPEDLNLIMEKYFFRTGSKIFEKVD